MGKAGTHIAAAAAAERSRRGPSRFLLSYHRVYGPRTTAVSLSVERAMIGVMPLRIWKSRLGWLVTDPAGGPSARSRPFNAPLAGRHPRRRRIRDANDARARIPHRFLEGAFTAFPVVAGCRNSAKIAFSGLEPAGNALISDGDSMGYGANSLLGGTMEFLYRTTNFRRANNRITMEIL